MRIVSLICLTLALAGCANTRTVTFLYAPTRPGIGAFPPPSQFQAEAQKECGRYGLVAVHSWDSWTSFQRIRSDWNCVAPEHAVPY
jgi:hypothetical protein